MTRRVFFLLRKRAGVRVRRWRRSCVEGMSPRRMRSAATLRVFAPEGRRAGGTGGAPRDPVEGRKGDSPRRGERDGGGGGLWQRVGRGEAGGGVKEEPRPGGAKDGGGRVE